MEIKGLARAIVEFYEKLSSWEHEIVRGSDLTPNQMWIQLPGDERAAIRFSDRLFAEGVFVTSVVYPTVTLETARLRAIVTAAHTDEHLDRALEAFDAVGRELGVIGG